MARAVACVLLLGIAGCSPSPSPAPLTSPSGALVATTEISGKDASATRRFCVRLIVREIKSGREMAFQTGASNRMKWALAWSPAGSLVLYSSDIGTRAYDIQNGEIVERSPDRSEEEIAQAAYRAKYR